ncbi:DUF2336 domain-containing protein [Roseibium algae]|uniref:DUF2336 domain-containing protein n=1 Tax=Roseibium algae TaxID=3123038 RepID=A0ABU8TL36_9HYPH
MNVLDQLEEETRLALSNQVGTHPAAPKKLVTKLASDQFSIAENVLMNSPVLGSKELEGIAEVGSQQHLDAIAQRDSLDEKITSILVDRGNRQVLTRVATNKNARMASLTFARLVEKARASPDIQAALLERNDIPEEAARNLAGFLTDELMDRVTSLGGDSVLADALAERAAVEVKTRASRLEASRKETLQIIEDVCNQKKSLDDAVSYFAKSDRSAELGILLAKVSDLPISAVSRLIYSKSDKPLMILCKANGVADDVFKHILTMRARHLQSTTAELTDAIQRYATLPLSGAKRSLEKLRISSQSPPTKAGHAKPDDKGAFRRIKKPRSA